MNHNEAAYFFLLLAQSAQRTAWAMQSLGLALAGFGWEDEDD